jgi:ABC-2 type transport system ATP-binding protein
VEPVIVAHDLTKSYREVLALQSLDLEVAPGTVFGYLGPNGAGKSTTIRILMGLIRPSAGTASVLGYDVVRERREVHRRVGYLPGDFNAYRDLTAEQYLSYLANLRGGVEQMDIDLLAKRFDLDLSRRIGTLSHGNRQKVGIIQAFMHRPALLVLDEPTSGLDPLMQREFLELVRETRSDGRTVFLSSHVLSEVEAVADLIGIIRKGRLAIATDVDELKERTRRRIALTFSPSVAPPVDALTKVINVRELDVVDRTVELTVEGSMAELLRVAAPFGIERAVSDEVDLEGVFLQYYEDGEM